MSLLEDLDPKLLVPNERNPKTRNARPIDDLLASIPEVGIVQPLVVVATTDGRYEIQVGHRRHRAALALGLPTVPCLVAPDGDAALRLAAMLAENAHRADFTPSEEGELYAQLALLDWDEDRIAAFRARPVEEVRAAIGLTRMPEVARTAADTGALTLDEAAALAEFSGDATTVAKILARGQKGWGLKHVIADEKHKQALRDATERCKAELILAGVKVIKTPKGWPYGDQTAVRAADLADADGNPLDPQAVRTKPGFAAILTREYGRAEPTVEIVCTDPEAWGYRPVAGSAGHARAERDAAAAERQEMLEAFTAATQVRWQFLAETYGSARTAKNLYLAVLRAAVIDPDQLTYPVDRMRDLFNRIAGTAMEPDVAATAAIDRLTRMIVARWLCAAEDTLVRCATGRGWHDSGRQRALEYLDRLVADGYQLSDAETTLHDQLTLHSQAEPEAHNALDSDQDDDRAEVAAGDDGDDQPSREDDVADNADGEELDDTSQGDIADGTADPVRPDLIAA